MILFAIMGAEVKLKQNLLMFEVGWKKKRAKQREGRSFSIVAMGTGNRQERKGEGASFSFHEKVVGIPKEERTERLRRKFLFTTSPVRLDVV
jgi:hypothetical protein